eukprot:533555-Prorocentrum_minimum.AAC.2
MLPGWIRTNSLRSRRRTVEYAQTLTSTRKELQFTATTGQPAATARRAGVTGQATLRKPQEAPKARKNTQNCYFFRGYIRHQVYVAEASPHLSRSPKRHVKSVSNPIRPREAGPPSCPARGLVPCRPPLPGYPSFQSPVLQGGTEQT